MYKARISSSVYLKLDYGICSALRISNHSHKSKYEYKFCLRVDVNGVYKNIGKSSSYTYGVDRVNFMLRVIIATRKSRLNSSNYNYCKKLDKGKINLLNRTSKFWKRCIEI